MKRLIKYLFKATFGPLLIITPLLVLAYLFLVSSSYIDNFLNQDLAQLVVFIIFVIVYFLFQKYKYRS